MARRGGEEEEEYSDYSDDFEDGYEDDFDEDPAAGYGSRQLSPVKGSRQLSPSKLSRSLRRSRNNLATPLDISALESPWEESPPPSRTPGQQRPLGTPRGHQWRPYDGPARGGLSRHGVYTASSERPDSVAVEEGYVSPPCTAGGRRQLFTADSHKPHTANACEETYIALEAMGLQPMPSTPQPEDGWTSADEREWYARAGLVPPADCQALDPADCKPNTAGLGGSMRFVPASDMLHGTLGRASDGGSRPTSKAREAGVPGSPKSSGGGGSVDRGGGSGSSRGKAEALPQLPPFNDGYVLSPLGPSSPDVHRQRSDSTAASQSSSNFPLTHNPNLIALADSDHSPGMQALSKSFAGPSGMNMQSLLQQGGLDDPLSVTMDHRRMALPPGLPLYHGPGITKTSAMRTGQPVLGKVVPKVVGKGGAPMRGGGERKMPVGARPPEWARTRK